MHRNVEQNFIPYPHTTKPPINPILIFQAVLVDASFGPYAMTHYSVIVGAFERDNFGDIMCGAIVAKALRPHPTIHAAMVSSDMRSMGGRLVVSTNSLQSIVRRFGPPSTVIFAGGETLACGSVLGLAMNLSRPWSHGLGLLSAAPERQDRFVKAIALRQPASFAYVLSREELGITRQGAPIIFHSVGGTTLSDVKKHKETFEGLKARLDDARYIAVRDARTRGLLAGLFGIRPQLVPDSGFALRRVLGADLAAACDLEPVRSVKALSPYIVFQASAGMLSGGGLLAAAKQLSAIAIRAKVAIVLQPAGTAFGHDDLSQLADLARLIAKCNRDVRTYVQRNRHIFVQIAVIANAACWIGSSLHGRINSIAMRVPAVSLRNPKVKASVETWEPSLLPYDVTLDELVDAVLTAIKTDRGALEALASDLEDKAMQGLDRLATLVTPQAAEAGKPDDAQVEQMVLCALADENRSLREENLRLLEETDEANRAKQDLRMQELETEKNYLEKMLEAVFSSTSWRITAPLRAVAKLVRK